jgi:hypothetical protein
MRSFRRVEVELQHFYGDEVSNTPSFYAELIVSSRKVKSLEVLTSVDKSVTTAKSTLSYLSPYNPDVPPSHTTLSNFLSHRPPDIYKADV